LIHILLHDFFFKISSTIFYYSEEIFPSPFSGWLIFSLSIFISPHRIINSNYTEIAVFSTKLLGIILLFCRLFSPMKFLKNVKMFKENIFEIIYLIQIESYSKMVGNISKRVPSHLYPTRIVEQRQTRQKRENWWITHLNCNLLFFNVCLSATAKKWIILKQSLINRSRSGRLSRMKVSRGKFEFPIEKVIMRDVLSEFSSN